MEKINYVINFLRYLDSRKRSKTGYLIFLIFILILELIYPPISQLHLNLRAILFLVIIVISFNIWMFLSGRWILPTKKLKIGIALKSLDASTQKIIDKTLLLFNDELNKLRIRDKFYIYKIGHDVFNTFEQAEKYLNKWEVNLIIHGTIYSGNANSNYRYDLKNFNFTYLMYNTQQQTPLWDLVKNDIQLILSNRDWIIEESNDIIDTNKVSKNLVEILLSILSITLCRSYKHPEISIQLIKKVIPYLENHIPPEKKKIKIDKSKQKISMPINLLRSGRLRTILNSCYINTGRIFLYQQKYNEAVTTLTEGIERGANKYQCYNALSVAYFYLHNLEKAEFYTKKMNEIKRNTLNYIVNMAFFSIKRCEYDNAVNYYEETRNKISRKNNFVIEEVIEFLKSRQKEDKTEFAYQYAIGLLKYNHLDKAEGKQILLRFLKKAEEDKYRVMIAKIKFILKIRE